MTSLFSLPDEILVQIVRYLDQDREKASLDFWAFANWCEKAVIARAPSQRVKDLQSLMRSARRLRRIVEPFFYRHILVRSYPQPRTKFYRTLQENPSLLQHTKSAIVGCEDDFEEASDLFWYSVHTLTIVGFRDWHALEFESNDHVGTSSVQRLHLINCGAKESPLAVVLGWPAALKSLHYDADQGEWEGHGPNVPAIPWSCAAFVRALQPQKTHLQELTLTRPPLVHEGLFMGPRIDLHEFTALTTLRILDAFLCGTEDPRESWRSLPPRLETLEVYYDDTDYITFFDESEEWEWYSAGWLLELLDRKETNFANLSRITVRTCEYGPHGSYDWNDRPRSKFTWSLPAFLDQKCKVARVELRIVLGDMEWMGAADYDAVDVFPADLDVAAVRRHGEPPVRVRPEEQRGVQNLGLMSRLNIIWSRLVSA
ncbi:hypothetical protein FE257_008858 [Aspergillus nanangensis]|uniref:F-box domain-containing protein n=1 Tax=Aspergillus nanangensis TaxID=2582783 RepID=A0AAD4CM52_ASPNN|nr:hypothetical protein FE257_008858 [Aspergillus nanangensis]